MCSTSVKNREGVLKGIMKKGMQYDDYDVP